MTEHEMTTVNFNDALMAPSSDGLDIGVIMKAAGLIASEQDRDSEDVYYLSFAGEEGWRGGCFVRAYGPVSAVAKTHDLGFNPGGEVAIWGPGLSKVPDHLMDRLLTQEEVETNPYATEDD